MTTTAPNVAAAIETVESHLHPTPSWLVDEHPVPTGREEIWRFTPVKRFKPLLSPQGAAGHLAWNETLPGDVTMRTITLAEAQELAVEPPVDRIAALAHANATSAVLIDVPADSQLDEPVVIDLAGKNEPVFGNLIISVGANASVTIVLRYTGVADFAEKTDLRVADGANVNFVSVQDWDEGAVHGGQRSIVVGRDAHLKSITASLGGLVRIQENARFAGPGGELEAYGLYFVDSDQHVQHRLFVDHNAPKTNSNVDYRGALQGKGAHSVWIGDVLIRKVAEGIETYEANKNLLLTDGCQADSVPNLEIETGEIAGAGHSSTTGRFDDLQLFYLQSRGIPEAEARRLVVHGFFADIIRRIGVPDIEARLLAQVEAELELAKEAMARQS